MSDSRNSSPSPLSRGTGSNPPKPSNGSALRPPRSPTSSPLYTENHRGVVNGVDKKPSEELSKSSGPGSVRFAPIVGEADMATESANPDDIEGLQEGYKGGGILKRSVTESPVALSPHEPSRRLSDGFLNRGDSAASERERKRMSGMSTPPGRRSVQFARGTVTEEPSNSRSRSSSIDAGEGDNLARDSRGQSLLSKLKALAASSGFQSPMSLAHSRTPSAITPNDNATPASERNDMRDRIVEEDSDADADGEASQGEETEPFPSHRRKRRKSRRFADDGPQTAPVTPKTPTRPEFSSARNSPIQDFRPSILSRRATTTDMLDQSRGGVSEDEGRDRLNRDTLWKRRGSSWLQTRGFSYNPARRQEGQDLSDGKRPSNLRRLTGFVGEGSESAANPWRRHLGGERTTSVGAQRWKQLKASFKMIGVRKKPETPMDHIKSAELLAELTAGAPSAMLVASMFQRDEHGSRRVPVLLEQVRVSIPDSEELKDGSPDDRHRQFRIELEYGSGMTRMKWIIWRTAQDFAKMHLKYKFHIASQKYLSLKPDDKRNKLPRFPRNAFPYLRGLRNLDFGSDEERDEDAENENSPEGNASGAVSGVEDRRRSRRRPSLNVGRRRSSIGGTQDSNLVDVAGGRRDPYVEKQRKKLEIYVQQMINFLIFRPDSNRLCKFLELSALGVRLATEHTYHGKEGLLVIQSSKGLDFRRSMEWKLFKGRHTPKWFLVRHSYIVCVDSPEGMNIYDVFLVDSDFKVTTTRIRTGDQRLRDQKPRDIANAAKETATHPQHHRLKIRNSERKLRLFARNERQLLQFENSINYMLSTTDWHKKNRFDSFAPVRQNVFAQWLVDGRDYMWVVSRAISQAKDAIYIHDWWLSPELYMRRPAAISQKWRIDRLLKAKADQGVKIFIIIYRNVNAAIPIDSAYTKFSMLDLHGSNIFCQRSPNQFRQNTFFWAHHEKLCIIDHTVAFVGGIDLCFGRWDTPQHTVTDDKLTGFEEGDYLRDADHCQLWPGKDYSNPRVQDFYDLDRPYEEMYDRTKVPRMPWHDIHMQVVGQPARDLTRHFVQRWNYILRQRKPTRPTPFLLPPPDFGPGELEELGLDGTCEVQMLRSCGQWSMGLSDKYECSIQNAYIKMIEKSEHFIYIENQFFISSCEVETAKIENRIGDALVERIVRAHTNDEDWRAVILIPLMPGFQNTVDSQDGTSVRLIMQCQFRSICRGDSSIFGRLRAHGIEPEDYIQFYSLRSWGKIGPTKQLVTEQLYIHAKCMIVDDRVAIIGSANINERSMLGTRDSECAAVVRDTHMLMSTMNGQPYEVARFAHTLRVRLMREHLGIDVDAIHGEQLDKEAEAIREKRERDLGDFQDDEASLADDDSDKEITERMLRRRQQIQDDILVKAENMHSFNHDVDWEQGDNPNLKAKRKRTEDQRVTDNALHRKDVEGEGFDKMAEGKKSGFVQGRDTAMVGDKEVLVSNISPEGRGTLEVHHQGNSSSPSLTSVTEQGNIGLPPHPQFPRMTTAQLGLPLVSQLPPLPATDDSDIGGPVVGLDFPHHSSTTAPFYATEFKRPYVDKDCMRDPIHDLFFLDTWHAVAENNTKIFRQVFRCQPDSEVRTWKEYKEYTAYAERFSQLQGMHRSTSVHQQKPSGPPGSLNVREGLSAAPQEVEKRVVELHDKISGLVHNKDKETANEQALQIWAAEANRAQAIRQDRARRSGDGASSSHHSQESKEKASNHNEIDEKQAFRSFEDDQNRGDPAINLKGKEDPDNNHNEKAAASKQNGTAYVGYSEALNMNTGGVPTKRRRRATTRTSRREFRAEDDIMGMDEAEELLNMVQGHLVCWPYDWLCREEQGGNWLYSIDQLAPLEIYN